ncbi:MAG: hypothetical protein KGI25_07950 [Thaumarchaeota archaeon]|nr:hypothetical protein [Nitrososphaerota archaeon]
MDYLPPTNAVSDAYTLLSIIADPKTARDNLDAIAKKVSDVNSQFQSLRDLENKIESEKKDLALKQASFDSAQETINTKTKQLDQRSKELDAREVALSNKEGAVISRETDIINKETELANKSSALTNQANSLTDLAQQHAKTSQELTIMKADLQKRLSKLKEIAID